MNQSVLLTQSKLQGFAEAKTDQEPSETGMLVLIARCLLDANLPSLSKHCLRAAELILSQQELITKYEDTTKINENTIKELLGIQKVANKARDRMLEYKWKDQEITKAEEQDYQRNLVKQDKLDLLNAVQVDWVTQQMLSETTKVTK